MSKGFSFKLSSYAARINLIKGTSKTKMMLDATMKKDLHKKSKQKEQKKCGVE